MSYIITVRTNESILMASDTRLNYFDEVTLNGKKYQRIIAVADCIRKTFFIEKAKIGIQFLGIGFFQDIDGEKYPLSHFVSRIDNMLPLYGYDFEANSKKIFEFLKGISRAGDTGRYVIGIMSGFSKNGVSYLCDFNTYNNEFEIKEFHTGLFVDSENNRNPFPTSEKEAIEEINKRIDSVAMKKCWSVGGPVEILKITYEGGVFIKENPKLFNGTQKELIDCFKSNINKINGIIFPNPILVEYQF
jgi:hypothetical protein